ncbi:MAG: hypothetical protein JNK58_03720 [Phycisphaerae bacterium]|nr:hypothetical protein [Phycisphaerae bacterium]
MLKFLRRHNKIILMVGGSILMVLFLLPSTTRQLGQSGLSRAIAYVDGQKVTMSDLQEAVRELQMLEAINPGLVRGLGVERNPEHWLLLVHEARRAGMIGGPKDARKDLPANVIDMLRASASESRIDQMLANLRGVLRLISASSTASLFSSRESIALGHRMLDTASINVVVIPASKIGESLPPPTEADLAAHFEKYRDTDPTLPESLGVGYRRPDAVQIEWLSIDRSVIEASFTPDPIEVNKYWRQNQAKFTGEFAAVKAQVEIEYKKAQIDQALARVTDVIKRDLFKSTAGLPTDGAYKTLPPDWTSKMPPMSELSALADAELRKQFPSLSQGPTVVANDGTWRTGTDLSRLPNIGFAFIEQGNGSRLMFSQLALMTRELGGPPLAGVQDNIVFGPLKDFRGSYHYFRVLASRKAGPPASLDEVRDAVVRDVRASQALEKLKGEIEPYRERVIADGLDALAASLGTVVRSGVEVTGQMVRSTVGSQVPDATLDSPEVRDAVMNLARTLDPTIDAATLDPASRTVVVHSPKARGLVAAQITRFRPMSVELFHNSASEIADFASREFQAEGIVKAFSFDRLKQRHDYKVVDASEKKKKENTEAETPAPAAGS